MGKPRNSANNAVLDAAAAASTPPAAVETPPPPPPPPALRLEWVEAGQLAENPHNWRKHSQEQLQTIKELVNDPSIGWAGACLYNERTKRLIDGHARRSVVDPKTLVPVLVGNWSEDAEAKILATLDPVGDMGAGDAEAYAKLADQVAFDSLWLRDLVAAEAGALANADDGEGEGGEEGEGAGQGAQPESLARMQLEPFEHFDYLVILARNVTDWEKLVEVLKIGKRDCSRRIGSPKIGLGRAIESTTLLKLLAAAKAV